ncbi:MAG: glutaredoxin family protein [Lysobacterales bacterium]
MRLQFYHREHCELCDQALAMLHEAGLDRIITMIDIDADPELGVAYGLRIPVVESSDGRALDWPFDIDAVQALLS